jgi:hypothetical protein
MEIIKGDVKQAVEEVNRLLDMHYDYAAASFRVCDIWRINKKTLRDAFDAQYEFKDVTNKSEN